MENTRRTSEYTADDSMIVTTIRLYLVFDCQKFSEAVCTLYPMRNVADNVVLRDVNVRAVSIF